MKKIAIVLLIALLAGALPVALAEADKPFEGTEIKVDSKN